MSQKFKKKYGTEHLLLSSKSVLVNEGVVDYFERAATAISGAVDTREVGIVLEYVRDYVGGHIYPLMWISEQLIQRLTAGICNAAQAIDYLHSDAFRKQEEYQEMVDRCLPDVATTNVRPLLHKIPNPTLLYDLKRKGFCDKDNKIISQLRFQEFIAKISSSHSFSKQLSPGVEGVRQLLQFALPKLNWEQYNAFGGPIEDALTLELLIILSGVPFLQTRLFNPKLVNVGTAVRKPDIYLNSSIDAFVECVLTTANNKSEVCKLDEHILRFFPKSSGAAPHYVIGQRSFAILNYQLVGDQPMKPSAQFQGNFFDTKVFTFLINKKEVYLGSTLIAGP